MNKGLVSGIVLMVFGVVCGLLLAVVNYYTAPVIEEQEIEIKREALAEIYNLDNYTYTESDFEQNFIDINVDLFNRELSTKASVDSIYYLTNKTSGEVDALVYLISAYGYDATPIQMLIGVNKDLTIQGYKVVSQHETTGYGSKIVDRDFSVSDIDDLSTYDGIAGVTFSSKAVLASFTIIQDRVEADFGGGSSD